MNPASVALGGHDIVVPPGFPGPGEDSAARRYLTSLIDRTAAPPQCLELLMLPVPADTTWDCGRISARLPIDDVLTLTPGVVFGGYVMCLVDHFASLVMLTVVPDGALVLTAAVDTALLAPLAPGAASVEARVTKLSARRALAEVTIRQGGSVTSRSVAEQIIKRPAPAADTRRLQIECPGTV
jgi:acyl-coenzyme A thioesterase PaaI-like protein